MPNRTLTHAGCVVFRPEASETLFLIVSSKHDKHWVLPKGKIDTVDKTIESTALRELKEEAGVEGRIIQPISIQSYTQKDGLIAVQYYIVEYKGEVTPKEDRVVRWETAEMALELISFDETKKVLQEALDIIRSWS